MFLIQPSVFRFRIFLHNMYSIRGTFIHILKTRKAIHITMGMNGRILSRACLYIFHSHHHHQLEILYSIFISNHLVLNGVFSVCLSIRNELAARRGAGWLFSNYCSPVAMHMWTCIHPFSYADWLKDNNNIIVSIHYNRNEN